jgi:hypothetical protein
MEISQFLATVLCLSCFGNTQVNLDDDADKVNLDDADKVRHFSFWGSKKKKTFNFLCY